MKTQILNHWVFACVLFGLLAVQIEAAEIFQWTDENGKVHFSDKPPRDQKTENISDITKHSNIDSSKKEREKVGQIFAPITAEEQAYEQNQVQNQTNQQQALQNNCAKARSELEFFQKERFYWVDEEGNESDATEAERQQKINELTAIIAKYCR